MKTLKIMPEYGMYPIWITDSNGQPFENISPDELNIAESARQKLENWDMMFQNTFIEKCPPDSGFDSPELEAIFEKEGVEIWSLIKKDLFSKMNVVYYSVIENKLYTDMSDFK